MRSYFDAIANRDRRALCELLDPDLVHRSPWKIYASRDPVLDDIWPHLDGSFWVEELEVFPIEGDDDWLAAR